MEEKNEVNDFFEGLPSEDKPGEDIFDEKPAEQVRSQEDDEPHKNRRHRRLEAQLQEEREARIAAEARAQALSETQRFKEDTQSTPIDQRWLQLYGDSPASRQAWKIEEERLEDFAQKIQERTANKLKEERMQEIAKEKEYQSFIDGQFETIEDEYNVDLTSNAPAARKARSEFIDMISKLSPKDENGQLTAYADFPATWEAYQARRGNERSSNTTERQKEIASRSMRKSGGVDTQKADDDSTLRYLREQGIRI